MKTMPYREFQLAENNDLNGTVAQNVAEVRVFLVLLLLAGAAISWLFKSKKKREERMKAKEKWRNAINNSFVIKLWRWLRKCL